MSVQNVPVPLDEIKPGDHLTATDGHYLGMLDSIDADGCLKVIRFVQPDFVLKAHRYMVVDNAQV